MSSPGKSEKPAKGSKSGAVPLTHSSEAEFKHALNEAGGDENDYETKKEKK